MNYRRWLPCLLLAAGCTPGKEKPTAGPPHVKRLPASKQTEKKEPPLRGYTASYHFNLDDFYSESRVLEEDVQRIYNRMPDAEKAAQLIMPATGLYKDYGLPFNEVLQLYRLKQIGGVLLLKGNVVAFSQQVQKLNQLATRQALLPLMFSIDGEPALIHRKLLDVDSMTPAAQQVTDRQVMTASLAVAGILNRLGAHLNFAPVADCNINTAIIDRRSYGADAGSIVHKANLFIAGHRQVNKACVIKHFPGHGAVEGDSHTGLVSIDGALTELPVFTNLLMNSRPAGVMAGHIAIENSINWQTSRLPASLSPVIMKKLLRDSLGFTGLIFTDAMNMGAVAGIPGADFLALKAGADVVVMPRNVRLLHRQITAALHKPGLLTNQLKQSIMRVIRLKICLGVITLN